MTSVGTSFPIQMLETYPNIRPVAKTIKTEELQGLYLDFVLADISDLFEKVTLVHDASLRPSMIKTVPSTSEWDPRNNRAQAEMAITAINRASLSENDHNADLTERIKKVVVEKIGPVCTITVYEK
jgi:hypothetical protein